MAEEEDKESKTEEPTEKKIKDALQKGQTATSREVPLLTSLVLFDSYLVFSGADFMRQTSMFLSGIFEQAGTIEIGTALDAHRLYKLISSELVMLLAPLCLMLMAGGIASAALQNEPRLVLNRIAPKASKLSIAKGWSRLFGKQGLVEFAKNISKLMFCGSVVALSLYSSPEELLNGMFQDPVSFGAAAIDLTQRLLIAVCLAMTVIAVTDLVWSRFSWRENLKMSRKEVTDEVKQAEGDQIVKARLRSISRDRSRQRMMDAVPTATLIIANPPHIAIALRFDAKVDDAPVVIAKGQDLIAQKIKEIAAQNAIPIFERVEMARALNREVQIGQIIPSQFYTVVAELINIIYNRTSKQAG